MAASIWQHHQGRGSSIGYFTADGATYGKTLKNVIRDGIETHYAPMRFTTSASIRAYITHKTKIQRFREKPVPVRYSLELKQEASNEDNYATLTHELGHLYCGHLGTHQSQMVAIKSRYDASNS